MKGKGDEIITKENAAERWASLHKLQVESTEDTPLDILKQHDLYQHGVLMSRDKDQKDFIKMDLFKKVDKDLVAKARKQKKNTAEEKRRLAVEEN